MLQLSSPYYRPFLKWAGGKSKLIEQYIPHFPQSFTNYYEPFLGGGAVFFYFCNVKPDANKVISDINPELINTYCCIKNNVEPLIELLNTHQEQHDKDYYYRMRSHFQGSDIERAARFIYLNKTCFNGLYRENSQGRFNVPMGKYKNPTICNSDLLRSVSLALQSAEVSLKPYSDIKAKNEQDFVYFDPPYYPLSSTSNFTTYSRYIFKETEQIKLRDTFAKLASRGVKVMLSNSDCALVRELYADFNIYEISAARAINSKAEKRGKITELLITSY
ncbi:DNA adenine methylase [Synechocystis sp. PCC 7509]|uniref:DNA adenine methylase n=1 Tax=Synechocystis sp. PCC 7509 TaxID=927677 RepID=UPI0002ABB46E|nr:DNA adenine methylase [Synechocystis sp. PCC 7509]